MLGYIPYSFDYSSQAAYNIYIYSAKENQVIENTNLLCLKTILCQNINLWNS